MTELTDLNDTDALNTAVTGQSTEGNVANMGGMDNLFQATLGMLSRFRNSNIFRLRDNTDKTKLLAFDLSGLTTATTRTLTVPDASGTVVIDQGTFRLKQSAAPTPTAEGDIQWGTTNDEIVVGSGSTQKVFRPLTLHTAQVSTSGTQTQFFFPAGVRRITINFVGVSTNGTNALIVLIGDAGGVETTGYSGGGMDILAAAAAGYTTAFGFGTQLTAASSYSGTLVLTLENAANNTWCANGAISRPNDGNTYLCSGSKSLSQPLDRLIVQTVGGTNTFDAGEINVLYE